MKKKVWLFITGVLILTVLIGVQILWRSEQTTENTTEYAGEETRITRAGVARMISLLKYSRSELMQLTRTVTYTDTNASKWYDKFINGYYTMGLTEDEDAEENLFHPMSYFTYEECRKLIERIALQLTQEKKADMQEMEKKCSDLMESFPGSKKEEAYMLPEEWIRIYDIIRKEGYGLEGGETPLYVIESFERNDDLSKWQVLTDKGIFYNDGLDMLPFIDRKKNIYVSGTDILYVGDTVEEETRICNIFILDKSDRILKVYVNGCTREFEMAGSMEEEISNQVGDIFIENGKIVKVSIKPDRIKGRVLVANDNYIEIEGYGRKALSEEFCIYRTYGEISMDKTNSLVVGYENAEFVIVGDEICAAIITEPVEAENIRVLIKTEGFKDYYHEKLKVTSDGKFIVAYGDTVKKYKAGKVVEIDPDSKMFEEGRIFIKSTKGEGTVTVTTLKRNGIHPSYQGTLEIASDDKGLLLINELSVENYLYGVVPSEMPASYGLEPLKVQAVCARSYAYKQLLANGLRKFGAHVDDSASYQVYNNIPTNEDAVRAVNATCGETMEYKGDMITAYYFSTSCGHTANADEVWNGTEEIPYLVGELQIEKTNGKTKKKTKDLSGDEDFYSFITEDKYKTYDRESPWYRWQVTISKKDLEKSIDKSLAGRYEANKKLIQVLQEDGSYKSIPVSTVGKVKSIEIKKRRASGIVTEILIEGSKNTIKVESEYNIRLLLAPLSDTIIRQDDSKVESLSMLPSAFFYLEEDKKSSYRFVGGGYGHGVGMSQNGAKAMADLGYTYQEILAHYYRGAKIVKF